MTLPKQYPNETLGERHARHWIEAGYIGGLVYVLRARPLTAVKIGYTTALGARILTLQTGCPYPLRPLYVIPADQELETWLHRHLKKSRLEGEWFDGVEVAAALRRIEDAATAMVADHDGSPVPPSYLDYCKWLPFRRRQVTGWGSQTARLGADTTIRFVEPAPLSEEERLANLRAHYLRPARAILKRGWP